MELIKENVVKEFVDKLPDIESIPLSAHLLMLAVRSRFVKAIFNVKIKDMVVERKIIRSNPGWREVYFQKVYNLALLQQQGSYTFRNIGQIPSEGRAIFGTLMPRHVGMATKALLTDAMGYFCQEKLSDDGKRWMGKIDNKFFGALHAHKHRTPMLKTVDIDDALAYTDVRDTLSSLKNWMTTKTSRGYHIIKDLSAGGAEEFHRGGGLWDKIHAKWGDAVELQHDSQEPIPGTLYRKVDKPDFLNYVEIIE